MRRLRRLAGALALLAGGGAAAVAAPPLPQTVADLDLARYMGRWYQIALLPNRFQEFCARDTTADYRLRDDGRVAVVNQCRDGDGELRRAQGEARLHRDYDDPARLQVRFAPAWLSFLPFVWGDYWVLELTDDYAAALVGSPDREYLWVLARTPRLDADIYARLRERAARDGFAVEALEHEPGTALVGGHAAGD